MTKKFLRRNWKRHNKLGRKKKRTWRKPRGRDNKMRKKRKGYPKTVDIGYKKKKTNKKKIRIMRNLEDLEKARENEILVLGNIGKKKKIEIIKKAKEKRIDIKNIDIKKFLEKEIKKEEKAKDKSKKKKIKEKKK